VTFELVFEDDFGNMMNNSGGGMRRSSADVDAVRFLFSSGALESGTITLYGWKNA
jgi:hypothetical protein